MRFNRRIKPQAIAIKLVFLVGLLIVLPARASDPTGNIYLDRDVSGSPAGNCKPGNLPIVTIVWQESNLFALDQWQHAIFVATRIYRSIGVELEWRTGAGATKRKFCGCAPSEIIELQVDPTADRKVASGALAYALPMAVSGIRIHVIHGQPDNIWETVPNLLGYVLAHEIGHVLQGVARHSDEGLLKAKWTGADYGQMRMLRLTFRPEDAEMNQEPPQRATRAIGLKDSAVRVVEIQDTQAVGLVRAPRARHFSGFN